MKNDYNWENKEDRAIKAKNHTREMTETYQPEIEKCIKRSHIYTDYVEPATHSGTPIIEVVDDDSVSALFHSSHKGRFAILNFASYKNPGGKFIEGSRAQEECLCHESWLYNVLKEFDSTYYTENRNKLNKGLYTNRAIYTPDVRFDHNNYYDFADVLTCAAPNKGTAMKYQNASEEECLQILKDRIKFIIDILTIKDIDNVILGAYGCGVFKQDPYEVANVFKDEIDRLGNMNVIFAIPKSNRDNNYQAFEEVFNKYC